MDGQPGSPVLIINPASAWELAALARDIISEGRWTPATLEAELRRTYANVVVHSRELDGERVPTWYVYREGRWISSEALMSPRLLEV